jgi:polyisoprenoid-binding protein YceI
VSIKMMSEKSTEGTAQLRRPAPKSSMRRLRMITLALIGALLLAACTAQDAPPPDAADLPAATAGATAEPEPEPTGTPAPEPAPTAAPAAQEAAPAQSPASASQTFVIVAEESEARFIIDEELLGQPKTVVGTTRALSGVLTVDPTNPAASAIGPIQIDASTLVTDNSRRTGAINRFILQTSQFRFITFTPTALSGLPDVVSVGDELQFEITGDLTVRDITAPVQFAATVQVVSESELRGSATTVVARAAYELTIPRVPSVANVGEEFIIEFDFVARAG